jgi:hypothetical protein
MTLRIRSSSGQMPIWFGIPFLAGGIFAAILGFVLLQEELRFGREGVPVAAVVTGTDRFSGGEDGPSYEVRYEFDDPLTGFHYFGRSDIDESTFDRTSVGDAVEVTYLPADPNKSRVGSPEPQLLIPLIVFGVAALFAIVGAGLLWLTIRIRRHGVPSWVTITSTASATSSRAAADDLAELPGALVGLFGGARPEAGTGADAGAASASAQPERALTTDELRALDARLAAPPPPAHSPKPDDPA